MAAAQKEIRRARRGPWQLLARHVHWLGSILGSVRAGPPEVWIDQRHKQLAGEGRDTDCDHDDLQTPPAHCPSYCVLPSSFSHSTYTHAALNLFSLPSAPKAKPQSVELAQAASIECKATNRNSQARAHKQTGTHHGRGRRKRQPRRITYVSEQKAKIKIVKEQRTPPPMSKLQVQIPDQPQSLRGSSRP